MTARAALAACLLLAACDEPAPPPAAAPEPAAVADLDQPCRAVEFEGSPLIDCEADPARHRIRMVLGSADGAPYRSFAALAAARGVDEEPVAFAVNGGMFDDTGGPIGYYVEGGERGHALNRADGPGNFHLKPNGVFYGQTGGDWRVRDSESFYHEVTDRPDFGTQSGPMLVVDGDLHPQFATDGDSLKIRNAVGVDARGRAHFVLSAAPISFGRMARYFRDEVGADNALFLDGQVSQLWDPGHGRMDNGVSIGPIIVVEMREDAG